LAREPRRLAAIVSADVAGYSRLMGADDSGTLAALKGHRRELIDPKISEYGGRIVKTTGDGLLLEFPSIVDAVRCAVDVQRGMAQRNTGIAPDQRFEFRVGINVGDIIIDGDDIYGDGVNVAARLQTLAEPGEICASRVVRDQVQDKLSFTFEDLGSHQVKNIARPVEVFRIDLGNVESQAPNGGRGYWRRATGLYARPWLVAGVIAVAVVALAYWTLPTPWKAATSWTPPPMSVALLQFATPDGSTDARAYAEVLRQDLTTKLATARNIKTIKEQVGVDAAANSRESGRRLNVRYVVEGDVRRAGSGNTVNLRLIDVATGGQLWGQRYELPDSATAAESALRLRKMVGSIGVAVDTLETRRVLAEPIEHLNAVELALRGDAAIAGSATLASLIEARKLYDASLRLDPNYVPALLGKYYVLNLEIDVDPNFDRDRIMREMDELTARAVNLDPAWSRTWRARAGAFGTNGRWPAAMEAMDESIRLDPDSEISLVEKARLTALSGRPEDALAMVDQAMAKSPTYLAWPLRIACEAHLLLGHGDITIATCEKAAALDDVDWTIQSFLAAAYANQGNLPKAVAAKDRLLRTVPDYSIAQLRSKHYSDTPEYMKLAEANWYPGLRKSGIPEN